MSVFSLTFAAALFFGLVSHIHATPTKLGDLDDDGVFTANDLAKLVGHSSGTTPLSPTLQPFADLTLDGFINDADHDALVSLILESSTPQNLPLASIREVSPATGEGDVAVTRETVLHFSMPLALNAALDTSKLYAEFGGRKILSRVEISSDKKKATLFYLEPLPSNARIRVSFDSTGVNDLLGRAIDGDGDGQTGGSYITSFDTLSITPVAGTAISGRVFASERGTGGNEVPLAGVTITVDGAEQTLRTTTDAQGNFTLNPSPAGSFFVHIDGRTSHQSAWPNGDYYPSVGKRWEALAGRTDNLSGNSEDTSRGTIYLPRVLGTALKTVSQTQDTQVEFPASVLAANPALAGTELIVPANSLFADDGTRGGRVGIAPVAPDRLPSPLPPGLNLPMVITIQTDGATNFDRPVPICFPNLPDPVTGEKLPPGAKSALWSFNHDLGDWEVVGPMTVTEDGNFVKTDAGVGVLQPGWHGNTPGAQGDGSLENGCGRSKGVGPSVMAAAGLVPPLVEAAYGAGAGNVAPAFAKGIEWGKNLQNAGAALSPSATHNERIAATKDLLSAAGSALNDNFAKAASWASTASGLADILEGLERYKREVDKYHKSLSDCLDLINGNAGPTGGSGVGDQIARAASLTADAARNAAVAHGPSVADANRAVKLAIPIISKIEASPTNLASAVTPSELSTMFDVANTIVDKLGPLQGQPSVPDLLIETAKTYEALEEFYGIAFSNIHPFNPDHLVKARRFARLESERGIVRFIIGGSAKFSQVTTPSAAYLLTVYDPPTERIGRIFFLSPAPGTRFNLPTVIFGSDSSVDTDGDTLSDEAETIIGTSPNYHDTDNDGVTDSEELKNGTDPLSGITVATGIVVSAPTSSSAIDIAAANSIAVAAHGSSGFTLFNVLAGLNPARLLEQDTQGFAQAVSIAGSYGLIADREGGAVILDLRDQEILLDPARRSAALVPVSVGGQATAVATDGVTGFVGTSSGQIVVLDIASRLEVSRLTLPSGSTVEDLQIEGEKLYALQTNTLRVLSITGPTLAVQGSLGLSLQRSNMQVRFRLFVGNGLAYATHSRGYHLVDVTTPTAPSLVRSHSDNQFGWKHMIQNGSGLGLACASPNSTPDGPHHLSLYNVGTDGRSSDFLTTIETPGIATGVSVYNGLAYVADGSAGLQVVNYRAFDTLRVPPTIQLASNFNLAGGSAEEGKRMRLTATVTDDVQVRNVEFYVDGQLSATDGNFPFEHALLTPVRTPEKQTFTVRAKATDTGGNLAWSTEYTVNLTPDATPPTVASISPPNNALVGAITETWVVFSEPMDVASLTHGIQVTSAGPDATLGTADDVTVGATLGWRSTTNTAFVTFANALSPGRYQIRVAAPAADAAGNALAAATTSAIRVFSFTDTDNDGMADDWESLLGLTVGDDDSDNNGILDGAEDFDSDGLNNFAEILLGFDPRVRDSNGNGIDDGLEDNDLDGLTTQQEFIAGTNPNLPDSDNDQWPDGAELDAGSLPNAASSIPKHIFASSNAPLVTTERGVTVAAPSILVSQEGTSGMIIAKPPVTVRTIP